MIKIIKIFISLSAYVFDSAVDALINHFWVIKKNFGLFFGIALFFLGVFGFSSGKYCDGNAADYLSCTRPSTYYYYDTLHIAYIIIGAFLVMVWFLRKKATRQ
jgi:hypothetical protein